MIKGFGEEHDLPPKLIEYLKSKGCWVETVDAGIVPRPNGGDMLCVNFLPSSSCLLRQSRGWENAVKWILIFLVRKGYSRMANAFQTVVNYHRRSQGIIEALAIYGCDSNRLRKLEGSRHSLFNPLSRMDIGDLVNFRSVRSVVIYSKYLEPGEYLGRMTDDMVLGFYLLGCAEMDWLSLSEIIALAVKTSHEQLIREGRIMDRVLPIVRSLLERKLMGVGILDHLGQGNCRTTSLGFRSLSSHSGNSEFYVAD